MKLQTYYDDILRWLTSCIGVGSFPYSPIYSTWIVTPMSNFMWFLQEVYKRKAAETETEQKRKAAYQALDVPEEDAKKYLGKEEYAEFIDSIPGAIGAYLSEGEHNAMDRRAQPYLLWVRRAKNLRREKEAESMATRQASVFNKELNRAIEKLKDKLYTGKQNPST
jgi:hypothetical protein